MPATAATIASPAATPDLCLGCEYSHRLASGVTHYGCIHPATARLHANPLARLIEAQRGALPAVALGLHVVGDPHAVTMGWFSWPFNFSPSWLVSCDGFRPAEGV